MIEDWPDPDDDFAESEDDEELANDMDGDPAFVERDPLFGPGPMDEPAMNNEELRQSLEMELGDLADEEWIDMCEHLLSIFYSYCTQIDNLNVRRTRSLRQGSHYAPIPGMSSSHPLLASNVQRSLKWRLRTTRHP